MGKTEQTCDLYHEYFRLMTIDEDRWTPELVEEAENFIDAVDQVMGRTEGLGMAMVAQVRTLLLWNTIKKA